MAICSPRWIRHILAGTALIAAGSVAISVASSPIWAQGDASLSTKTAPTAVASTAQVTRGRYIATAADCVACHTATDGRAFAGGLPLKTPFGTLLSSNITADGQTGIGGWTQQQFEAALRRGEGRHGHLYPAMPYPAYTKMSDADVADLWAYMRTVTPVTNRVDENQLPFPFNVRPLLAVWNFLFFQEGRFHPDPKASAIVNRGAYLSNALEHCGTCHTPKNLLGADKGGHALEGATLQNWHAPDLTNNGVSGLGHWSASDITAYLKTGSNRLTAASGPMGEAIINSTQHLSDADLAALAAYFKALPVRDPGAASGPAAGAAQIGSGRDIYAANCAACHTSSGQGVKAMVPSFVGNPALAAKDPTSLLHVVLQGTQGTATLSDPTGAGMPRFDWKLTDQQIADALTYVRNSWGNAAPAVSADDVRRLRRATGGQAALASAK